MAWIERIAWKHGENVLCGSGSQTGALRQHRAVGWGGRGREVHGGGTYVYLGLLHVNMWQKPTITPQLKIN